MAGINSVHQQVLSCASERPHQVAGSWTSRPRDLVLSGHIPAVRIPSPRARDGRVMRRILIDSRDLDRLIEQWKEVDNSEANLT
jgi:hypothetical protein